METRQTEPATIADYLDEVCNRLAGWTIWHIECGEERGIERGEGWKGLHALDVLVDVVDELGSLPDDASDDAIDTVIAEAHEAISDAKYGAECDMRRGGYAKDQCIELGESSLRGLMRAWVDIELFRRAARDGQMPADRAQLGAAEVFVFNGIPGHPPQTGG